jgi:CubicO group peptidase (beta-lactamase class C family)
MDERRFRLAETHLTEAVAEGRLLGAAMQVARNGKAMPVIAVGRRESAIDGAPVLMDTPFLIASITKPVVCAAVMKKVEEGCLSLSDRVAAHLPDFGRMNKESVTVRHLLTHTSGLPDMLPDNRALRQTHQSLSVFVDRICQVPLLFEPGTQISYQSCGIAILSALVEHLEDRTMPEILETDIFGPLGMEDSSLGINENTRNRISEVKIPEAADGGPGGTDWDWNSAYWHGFAAPWGGMFSTARDLTVLCQMFLNGGNWHGVRVLGNPAIRAMTRDQTSGMALLPESERRRQRWGLGWRIAEAALFGDLVSERAFGHGGATGTVVWMDPESGISFVLLTNHAEAAQTLRPKLSDVIAGALAD